MPVEPDKPWTYSNDEENFSHGGDCATREEAVAEALEELDLEPGQTYWTGRKVRPPVGASYTKDDILEHLHGRAADEGDPSGDYSADWLPFFGKKKTAASEELDEIVAKFNEAVDAWVEKHDPPTWFLVEDIEEHEAPTPLPPPKNGPPAEASA